MEASTETLRVEYDNAVQERSGLRAEVNRVQGLVDELEAKAGQARRDAESAREDQRAARRAALLRGDDPPDSGEAARLTAEADQADDDAASLGIERDRLRRELGRAEDAVKKTYAAVLCAIRDELEDELISSVPAGLIPKILAVRDALAAGTYRDLVSHRTHSHGRAKIDEIAHEASVIVKLDRQQLTPANVADLLKESAL